MSGFAAAASVRVSASVEASASAGASDSVGASASASTVRSGSGPSSEVSDGCAEFHFVLDDAAHDPWADVPANPKSSQGEL